VTKRWYRSAHRHQTAETVSGHRHQTVVSVASTVTKRCYRPLPPSTNGDDGHSPRRPAGIAEPSQRIEIAMLQHGFLRVAAASPVMRVADCPFNADQILGLLKRAEGEGVAVLVFPELCLTGYTCADLFQHNTLLRGAVEALARLSE